MTFYKGEQFHIYFFYSLCIVVMCCKYSGYNKETLGKQLQRLVPGCRSVCASAPAEEMWLRGRMRRLHSIAKQRDDITESGRCRGFHAAPSAERLVLASVSRFPLSWKMRRKNASASNHKCVCFGVTQQSYGEKHPGRRHLHR